MLKWRFCSLLMKMCGMKALMKPCITQEKRLLLGIFLKNATALFGLVISNSKFPVEIAMVSLSLKVQKAKSSAAQQAMHSLTG